MKQFLLWFHYCEIAFVASVVQIILSCVQTDLIFGAAVNIAAGIAPKADLLAFVTHPWNQSFKFRGESQIMTLEISKAYDQVWASATFEQIFTIHKGWLLANQSKQRTLNPKEQGIKRLPQWKLWKTFNPVTRTYTVYMGVPQGSVQALTTILLHINDLLFCTSHHIHSYVQRVTVAKFGKILKSEEYNFIKVNAFKRQSCSLGHKSP